MADILKPKRGKHSTIERINPILQEGEIVFEFPDDENGDSVIKFGDGITAYNDLPAFIKDVSHIINTLEINQLELLHEVSLLQLGLSS